MCDDCLPTVPALPLGTLDGFERANSKASLAPCGPVPPPPSSPPSSNSRSLLLIRGAGSSFDLVGCLWSAFAGRPLASNASREFLKPSPPFPASAAFSSSYGFDSGFWTDVFAPPAAGPVFAGAYSTFGFGFAWAAFIAAFFSSASLSLFSLSA